MVKSPLNGKYMKELIPADTVDTKGNVWETTGENIRRGAKEFSEDDIKGIVDVLFPVGSIYCGENDVITSVGTWEQIMSYAGMPIRLGTSYPTGTTLMRPKYVEDAASPTTGYSSLRMWRRVS